MLSSGDTFDRYTIEALLGLGGMGMVYRAYDPRLHRRVALKVLSQRKSEGEAPAGPNSSEGAARMLREARAAAALDHPNAVSIFDVGEMDGVPFIAMELIEGKTLRALIGQPIAWEKRLRWVIDVARALAAAHKRGLVHRDIKPENVMVREDGVVKVLDFGIARRPDAPVDPEGATQQHGLEAFTGKGVVIGTPRYMSPEQMRGDALDGRSDQFAWGVLAYELLAGRAPWKRSDDSLAAVAELLTREPEPMSLPELPQIVESTVRRALAKSQEGRFASMDEIVKLLDPMTSSSPDVTVGSSQPTLPLAAVQETEMSTSSPTPGPRAPATPEAKRPRSRRIALVGAAVALLLAGGAAWVGRRPTTTPPQVVDASPSPRPTAMTELPEPHTNNKEAAAAYRAAIQAFRDGVGAADTGFQRAAELDPSLAPAHLRLAILRFQTTPGDARASFARAVGLRATLSTREQDLLWAFEPFIAEGTADVSERTRRLLTLTEKYPLDAEFYFHLGLAEVEQFALMDISALKKAVEIDPGFARAWWQLGQGEAYAGRFDAARVALDKCLDVSHAATSCLWNRICLSELEGRCEEVERDARQWTAIDGTDPLGRYAVAGALHARGRSLEAVAEALRQKESVETPADAPRSKLEDEILLALVRGDFTHALHAARSLEKLVESAQAETEHEFAAHAMIDALMESGQTSEAGAYAAHYAKRREAWLPAAIPEDFAVADDVVPLTLVARRAAKLVSSAEYLTQLDAWMSEWQRRLQKGAHGYVWLHGLAATAETPEDARLALARLGNMPIPPYTPKTLVSAGLGRAYLLAGRLDDAMPLLERASKSCMSLAKPVTHTRSHLWLGQAREAKHDVAGACAAYGAVIDRWGNARPRSVTADEARARQRALGCK